MNLKIVCSWCSKVMKEGPENKVSHGMCTDCEKKLNEELENETKNKGL